MTRSNSKQTVWEGSKALQGRVELIPGLAKPPSRRQRLRRRRPGPRRTRGV